MSEKLGMVARRNTELECGAPIGTLNIKLISGSMEFVTIPCTKPKYHQDACEFVGVELVITRRRRDDSKNAIIIPRSHD